MDPTHRFFLSPLRLDEHDRSATAGPSSSRSNTPAFRTPSRTLHRSSSVFSSSSRADGRERAKLERERREGLLRLESTLERLYEKYEAIPLEEDDVIDLQRGEVVIDRGKLRELERREFGAVSDGEGEGEGGEDVESEGYVFDSDEDELGFWDERSGLDNQFPEDDEKEDGGEELPWIRDKRDEDDLAAFLRANEAMRQAEEQGSDYEEEPGPTSDKDAGEARSYRQEALPLEGEPAVGDHASLDEDIQPVVDLRSLRGVDAAGLSQGKHNMAIISEGSPKGFDEDETPSDDASDVERLMELSLGDGCSPNSSSLLGKSRRRFTVEVVIPVSRAHSAWSVSKDSNPSGSQKDGLDDLFTPPPESQPKSVSRNTPSVSTGWSVMRHQEPTLDDLFSPPPSAASPVEPRVTNSRPLDVDILHDSNTRNRAFSSSTTRDGSLYYTSVMRSRNGVSLRYCKLCKEAGGERAEKAIYCKGRTSARRCAIDPETAILQPLATPAPQQRSRRRSTMSEQRHQSSHLGSDHEAEEYRRHTTPAKRRSRHCVLCQEAGGAREAQSDRCPGKRKRNLCLYEGSSRIAVQPLDPRQGDNGRTLTSSSDDQIGSTLRKRKRPVQKSRRVIESDDDLESLSSASTEYEGVNQTATNTGLDSEDEYTPSQTQPSSIGSQRSAERPSVLARRMTPMSSSTSRQTPVSLPRGTSPFIRGQTPLPRGATPLSTSKEVYTPKGTNARRCKYCHWAGGDRAAAATWCRGRTWAKNCPFFIAGEDALQFTPGPTPTPMRAMSHDVDAYPMQTPRRANGSYGERAARAQSQSQTAVGQPYRSDPDPGMGWLIPPSSPPVATSDRSSTPYRPQLTPVSVGSGSGVARSSSTRPKSILRRPSESPFPGSSSSKRTRFSLGPSSPSSASVLRRPGQLEDGEEEDDPLILDSSSPVSLSSRATASPGYTYSRFSREMTVRAADAGIHLGPGHTGRLPQSLIRSIANAKVAPPSAFSSQLASASRPRSSLHDSTLADSTASRGPSVSTTLWPTPPPSTDSRSSFPPMSDTNDGPVSEDVRQKADRARLMLPPPLPDKCFPTPPLSTRSTSSSSRQRSRSVSLGTPTPAQVSSRGDNVRIHPASAPRMKTSTSVLGRRVDATVGFAGKGKERAGADVDDPSGEDFVEWGLDEDAGDQARNWRESSAIRFLR